MLGDTLAVASTRLVKEDLAQAGLKLQRGGGRVGLKHLADVVIWQAENNAGFSAGRLA